MMIQKLSRRNFLKSLALVGAVIPFLGNPLRALAAEAKKGEAKKDEALPAGQKAVSESDPVAMAIGYKANIKDVDYKKYPKRKEAAAKNDFCDNCALYTASNGGWGKCQMLTSGLVAAKGWCGSYSRKS